MGLPSGNPLGSGHILSYIPPLVLIRIQYIPTQAIIQTPSTSKNVTSSIILPGWQYWKSWFSVLLWQLGLYFPVFTQLRWMNTEEFKFNIIIFSNWLFHLLPRSIVWCMYLSHLVLCSRVISICLTGDCTVAWIGITANTAITGMVVMFSNNLNMIFSITSRSSSYSPPQKRKRRQFLWKTNRNIVINLRSINIKEIIEHFQ